jgi:hypothetical protein
MKFKDKAYKEITAQQLLSDIHSVTLQLSIQALLWLVETTVDNAGKAIPNLWLFYNLLCRMRTNSGSDMQFRRPLILSPGKLQYSEEALAEDWNIGRRRVRAILAEMCDLGLITAASSKVASSIALTSLERWTEPSGRSIANPVFAAENSAFKARKTQPMG